jgi:hypothetical protein
MINLISVVFAIKQVKYLPVIPEHGSLRKEDYKFQVSLNCIVSPCLKKKKDIVLKLVYIIKLNKN